MLHQSRGGALDIAAKALDIFQFCGQCKAFGHVKLLLEGAFLAHLVAIAFRIKPKGHI